MKTKLFQRVMALLSVAILLVSVLPAGSALASEKPENPKISVKAVNGTDVKVTIEKTKGADGYEVWITSDCGYTGYKVYNLWFGVYNYNENPGDYINAATVEKDGTAVRNVTIKNLSKASVSVKVRAYKFWFYSDGTLAGKNYGEFSNTKNVKATSQKKGYKSSYSFSKVKKGDTIKFGTYEQNYPVNGKDPIEWEVLDKTKDEIFVMSKYALDCVPYDTESTDAAWETCTLRKWLNDKFYNAAFNKAEKAMIREKTVMNNDNPYGIEGGSDTKDKILLLSFDDVTNENFGFDADRESHDINRRCVPTEYAVAQGTYFTSNGIGSCAWTLRSPGTKWRASFVEYIGYVSYGDMDGAQSDECGVRPVMYLKLKSE